MATGHWDMIFRTLAPILDEAQSKAGKHVPCPVHGGKNGFRLFPDYAEHGSSVCNTCGLFKDGFATLSWVNRWSFRETLDAVANLLNTPPIGRSARGIEPSSRSDHYREEVVMRTETIGRSVQGCILDVRTEKPMRLRLIREADANATGGVITLRDPELLSVVSERNLQPGDRVRLTLQLRQIIRLNGFTGYSNDRTKELRKSIWTAEKLLSLREEEMLAAQRKADSWKKAENIRKLWAAAHAFTEVDPTKCPATRYLQSRGIDIPEADVFTDLRFAEKVMYEPDVYFPAMIAAVRDPTGRLVTLHKTFLNEEGRKADIEQPKKLSALPDGVTISGCAIRFGQPSTVLAVAEGIETALSVVTATGIPCWSCINAHGLETVQLPEGIQVVFIFEDKDRSGTGQRTARRLRDRLAKEGHIACIVSIDRSIPDGDKGIDWNDLLLQDGRFSFPIVRISGMVMSTVNPSPRAEAKLS